MSKQILLIDGNRTRRENLTRAFSAAGYEVAEFCTGKYALEHLMFNSVSAVVLDLDSPLRSEESRPAGVVMIKEIAEVDAFVPLIVIQGRDEILDQETIATTDLVLRRPLSERQVIQGVHNIIGETLRERVQRKSGYIFAFR